jgi:DNA-binding NtrC family response regulator
MTAATTPVPNTTRGAPRDEGLVTGRILLAEDDSALREMLVELLVDAGHSVVEASTGPEALARFRADRTIEVVLTDLQMPSLGGEAVLQAVRELRPHVPVVVMTAFGTIDSAVRLVRAGAFDYVTKPVGTAQLLSTLSRGIIERREGHDAGSPLPDDESTDARHAGSPAPGIIAESPQMRELLEQAGRVATVSHPVLLTGESGTGKEVIARLVHERSGRDSFIAVNCGAVPENLIESELFGHERGAFAGAEREKPGLFEEAHGGTLFLDEICELPTALQPALLRFLENGEVRRVGATRSRSFDVRVIAATNRDLEGEMKSGRFREDLYWRLNVLHLDIAPLRERPADVPALAHKFLREAGCPWPLDPATEALLVGFAWTGNVRELRNTMQRAATFATGPTITPDDLPNRLREANRAAALVASASQQQLPLRAVERAYVLDVLRRVDGNKSRAAEILGLDRKTLYRKLAEYASDPESPDLGLSGAGDREVGSR